MKKGMRNRIIAGAVIGLLVLGGLFFLAYRETEYSRQFIAECGNRAIIW